MSLIKAKAEETGLCCNSCQEEVNMHRCKKCEKSFDDGDIIYCNSHSHFDNDHYHEECRPEVEE